MKQIVTTTTVEPLSKLNTIKTFCPSYDDRFIKNLFNRFLLYPIKICSKDNCLFYRNVRFRAWPFPKDSTVLLFL